MKTTTLRRHRKQSTRQRKRNRNKLLTLESLENRLFLAAVTGVNGINVPVNLGLTGAGVKIGQVENGRPGKSGVDDANHINSAINPTKVFVQDRQPNLGGTTNEAVDLIANGEDHAESVAGVMIATDGVARNAMLYASADGATFLAQNTDWTIKAIQHVARQGVVATNQSFVISNLSVNGTDIVSLVVDYVSQPLVQDFQANAINGGYGHLTVQSRGNAKGWKFGPFRSRQNVIEGLIPVDHFNGINVGTTSVASGGVQSVWGGTLAKNAWKEGVEFIEGQQPDEEANMRRLSHIVAPGKDIEVHRIDNYDPNTIVVSGSSFAAPHVTGAVALLHERSNQTQPANHRLQDLRYRNLVTKAILMNSADKEQGELPDMNGNNAMAKTVKGSGPGAKKWINRDAADKGSCLFCAQHLAG
jgi:subtilisin family serine protease